MTINLPLSLRERLSGSVVILCATALPLLIPAEPSWRLISAMAMAVMATMFWLHYLRVRPLSLTIQNDGRLVCGLEDGRRLEVVCVSHGYVNPFCVSARLTTQDRRRRNLLLFGDAVTAESHRRVRRALLGFRPPKHGGDTIGGVTQSSARRGT